MERRSRICCFFATKAFLFASIRTRIECRDMLGTFFLLMELIERFLVTRKFEFVPRNIVISDIERCRKSKFQMDLNPWPIFMRLTLCYKLLLPTNIECCKKKVSTVISLSKETNISDDLVNKLSPLRKVSLCKSLLRIEPELVQGVTQKWNLIKNYLIKWFAFGN